MIGMHIRVDSLGRRLVQTIVSSGDDQKVLLKIEIKEYLDPYGALTPSWRDASYGGFCNWTVTSLGSDRFGDSIPAHP